MKYIKTFEDFTAETPEANTEEAEVSKEPIEEGGSKGDPEVVKVMRTIEEFGADQMEALLSDIANNYKINADELDNMDAKGISKHIMEAVKLLSKRTSN